MLPCGEGGVTLMWALRITLTFSHSPTQHAELLMDVAESMQGNAGESLHNGLESDFVSRPPRFKVSVASLSLH
jgi:hypothetical protein